MNKLFNILLSPIILLIISHSLSSIWAQEISPKSLSCLSYMALAKNPKLNLEKLPASLREKSKFIATLLRDNQYDFASAFMACLEILTDTKNIISDLEDNFMRYGIISRENASNIVNNFNISLLNTALESLVSCFNEHDIEKLFQQEDSSSKITATLSAINNIDLIEYILEKLKNSKMPEDQINKYLSVGLDELIENIDNCEINPGDVDIAKRLIDLIDYKTLKINNTIYHLNNLIEETEEHIDTVKREEDICVNPEICQKSLEELIEIRALIINKLNKK